MNYDGMISDDLEDLYNERFGVNLFIRPRGYLYKLSREPAREEIIDALESGEELSISGNFCRKHTNFAEIGRLTK